MYLVAAYLAVLAFLSLNSEILPDSSQAIGFVSWDMLDHAVAYGGLALLLMVIFYRRQQRWLIAARVLLMCSLLGVLFEYCQLWFTTTRHFSYSDAGANVLGAALGVFLFWGYGCVFFKRR